MEFYSLNIWWTSSGQFSKFNLCDLFKIPVNPTQPAVYMTVNKNEIWRANHHFSCAWDTIVTWRNTLCNWLWRHQQTVNRESVCEESIHRHLSYKLWSVQNAGTCCRGQGWFVRNLGWAAIVEWACCLPPWYYGQNEAPAEDNEISHHPLLGGQALRFCWDNHTGIIVMELAKSTDKIAVCRLSIQKSSEGSLVLYLWVFSALLWRHNGPDSVSNHQPHDCLLNRLFRRRSKKTSKLRVTGLCARNSPGTGEFPKQMTSTAENVSI